MIVDKIEPQVQNSIDNTSTIKGEPVLPQDVRDYLKQNEGNGHNSMMLLKSWRVKIADKSVR